MLPDPTAWFSGGLRELLGKTTNQKKKQQQQKQNKTKRILLMFIDRSFLSRCRVALVCRFLALHWSSLYIMLNPPPSTDNSLSAGLRLEELPELSPTPIVVSTTSSGPVAPLVIDLIAEALVRGLGNTLPTIISIQGNAP